MLQAIRHGQIDIVASWELAEELADVLRRPKLRSYDFSDDDIEDVLVLLAPFLPTVDVALELRDPDDAPVVAAALAGAADAIVTGDGDLLADAALRQWLAERRIDVLTPSELLEGLD